MIAVSTETPGFVASIGFACGPTLMSEDCLKIVINALALTR